MTAAVISWVTIIIFQLYFTFRTRLSTYYGFPKEYRNKLVMIMLVDSAVNTMAVGSRAYRSAPDPSSWTDLTGYERAQTQSQRDFVLVMVVIG